MKIKTYPGQVDIPAWTNSVHTLCYPDNKNLDQKQLPICGNPSFELLLADGKPVTEFDYKIGKNVDASGVLTGISHIYVASDDYKLAGKQFDVKLRGYLSLGGNEYGEGFSVLPFRVKFQRGPNEKPIFERMPPNQECWIETTCNAVMIVKAIDNDGKIVSFKVDTGKAEEFVSVSMVPSEGIVIMRTKAWPKKVEIRDYEIKIKAIDNEGASVTKSFFIELN